MLENLCLHCAMWYLGCGLLGLLLGRILFGGKSKQLANAREESLRYKSNFDKLLSDFKNYKATAASDLEKKEVEIFKLKKNGSTGVSSLSSSSQSLSSSERKWQQKSEKLAKEIINLKLALEKKNETDASATKEYKSAEKYKEKIVNLKSKVTKLKTRLEEENRKSVTAENEVVSMHAELDGARKKIKKQDALILEAKSESFTKPQQVDGQLVEDKEKEIIQLKSKIKKQDALLLEAKRESFDTPQKNVNQKTKKKVKRLKREISGYKKKVKTLKGKLKRSLDHVEVVETIDMKKLNSLIKNGTLLSKKAIKKKA